MSEEKKDCGCAKRAKNLLIRLGWVWCSEDLVYTWRDFKVKEEGVTKRHFRATIATLFIRALYPTWKDKPSD